MKVLHLNKSDIDGGAARGAYWLHQSLQQSGIESKMLVARKLSDDKTVLTLPSKPQRALYEAKARLDQLPLRKYPNRQPGKFSPAGLATDLQAQIDSVNPDVINLHWVCGGFLKPKSLTKFQRPLVWTLRDMWGFSGGCHYADS
ncbi:MAG: glycosyl transferase, partial [Phormidesmis sp.]